MLKSEAISKMRELEGLLHQEQNNVEYWMTEYNDAYDKLMKLQRNEDPLLERLSKMSIIQESRLEKFLNEIGV